MGMDNLQRLEELFTNFDVRRVDRDEWAILGKYRNRNGDSDNQIAMALARPTLAEAIEVTLRWEQWSTQWNAYDRALSDAKALTENHGAFLDGWMEDNRPAVSELIALLSRLRSGMMVEMLQLVKDRATPGHAVCANLERQFGDEFMENLSINQPVKEDAA